MRVRRFLVVALAGVLPWLVVTWPNGWYPLFSFGFARVSPPAFTPIWTYLERVGTIPPHLSAWPTAAAVYGLALALAPVYEGDERIVAGVLALAALNVGMLAASVSGQRGILAVPLGTLWLGAAAVWVAYGDRLPTRRN